LDYSYGCNTSPPTPLLKERGVIPATG